jgi:CheY-like chemotaxis protein
MSKPILVVEDDADIREALVGILRDEGFTVVEAAHGEEGLAQLRAHGPALILLDLMMPIMNGWQFRQAQLADPAIAGVPVVVISADASVRDKAASLGATAFLRKPIDLDKLLEIVGAHAG